MSYFAVSSCEEEKIVRSFIKHEGAKMRILRLLQWVTSIAFLLEVVKDMPVSHWLTFFHGVLQLPVMVACEYVFYILCAFISSNASFENQMFAFLTDVLIAIQIALVWGLCQDPTPEGPGFFSNWCGVLAMHSITSLLYSAFKSNIGLNLINHEEQVLLGTGCRRGHFGSRGSFPDPCSGYHSYKSTSNRSTRHNGGLTAHFFDPKHLNTLDEEPVLEKRSSTGQASLSVERYSEIPDDKFEMSFDDMFEDEQIFGQVVLHQSMNSSEILGGITGQVVMDALRETMDDGDDDDDG
ncbi:hypothetical protein L873DRAFT_1841977 [Choiromyces venosus 120613-1]|uniref:Uncharacterized protein n=1 Tax=Choiromyces venosus 120613-1 TaxID=1336337 RepID=A0A3N4JYJ0_9PEZI|nr:hypothetical protein L873DRAFT_1841977 [Choiromyces venosus 120613-1]